MKRKIIGVTVGTPIHPQVSFEKTKQAETLETLSKEINDLSGTVEVTSGEPTKENTVMTIDPNAEEIQIYERHEIDAMFGAYVTDIANLIGGIEE